MKKTFLSIVSLLLLAGTVNAQLTVLVDGTTTDVTNAVYNHNLTTSVINHHIEDFQTINTSINDEEWFIVREILSEPTDWSNYYCWGQHGLIGACYPASADILYTSDTVSIDAGLSGLVSVYVSSPSAGCATYRYHVNSLSAIHGYFDVEICSTLGVEEELPNLDLSIQPNPASNKVVLKTTNAQPVSIQIVDVFGKSVLNDTMYGEKELDLSKLQNGVYFVRVASEGMKPVSHKIIVNQ